MNNIETTEKQVYESVTCSVTEVETQGVLCASSDSASLSGGLSSYTGSAL